MTNPLALKYIRSMGKGDFAFIYHTGDEKAVIGIAEVVRGAYPDPKQKDPRLVVVDLRPHRALARPVSLAEMRANKKLAGFDLLRLPRLSVMPVPAGSWTAIMEMAKG